MTSISKEFLISKGDVLRAIEIAKLEGTIEYIEYQIENLQELLDYYDWTTRIITEALINAFKKDKEKYEMELKNILI